MSVPVSPRPTEEPSPRVRAPAPGPADVPRERLIRTFVDRPSPVTLICAPAGSGKTSLLANWIAGAGGAAIAWLSLDRHDDDPGLLWTGILGALRATGRFPVGARLHELVPPVGEVAPPFVEGVVAEVVALGEPVWLVLDDVHVLRHADALDSLALLVRSLEPAFHLVLASRNDPPLSLPRLRLEGRLRELRAADLAFTLDEAATFLASQGVILPEASQRVLYDRTEGWVAGVKIAALALRDDPHPEEFVARFGGDDHAVADYLVTEVLVGLPDPARTFLLRTSVCEEVGSGLAQRLTGRADAAQVLDGLERENVFTRRLGRGRDSYRYHELLRTFLAAELKRSDLGLERRLHAQAADWWLERGAVLHAMEHLTSAGATDRLAELAEAHGARAILDGRTRRLAGLLAPLEDASAPPAVRLVGAAAAMELGDLDTADRWLLRVDVATLSAGSDRALAVLAASVGAARARYSDRVDVALTLLEATEAGALGDPDLDLYALLQRGVLRLYVGRYAEAGADLERAAELARITRRPAVQIDCLSFLGGTLVSQSRLSEMRVSAERAIELAERRGWAGTSALAHAYLLVAWAAYLRGDVTTTESNVVLAVTSLGDHNEPDVELAVRSLEAVVIADGGDAYGSLQRYRRTFARLADAQMSPALLAYALPVLVRRCLELGERGWARDFAEAARQRCQDPGEPALVRAMLLRDAGSTGTACRELEAITLHGVPCHVVTTEVTARVLAAELEGHLGHAPKAHDLLLDALRIAEPLELIRPFLDSDSVHELLVTRRGRFGHLEPFVERITEAARPDALSHRAADGRLTSGELALLRELPSLLSLREIAEARSVSLNTVKTHVRAIYRKLEVTGRREAVEAARRRGLL